MDITLEKYADTEAGGFFDRPSDAPPIGGLDLRRKPFQDSPTPGANSIAAIALSRMNAFTGEDRYRGFLQQTLEAFAGIAPRYGLFAATYGLAAVLFANHPSEVIVTGAENDSTAQALYDAANRVYRLGKSVVRITPGADLSHQPLALRETLPHLPKDEAAALVCSGNTCLPPIRDPVHLAAVLEDGIPIRASA
jgi:uncharacterized protein YyaL (SSP411 family)